MSVPRLANPATNPNGYMAAIGAVLAAAIMISLAGCGSSAPAVTTPPQPLTVQQVANIIGATYAQDCPDSRLYVAHAGIAYLSGRKIGIDTFASQAGRDSWLTMAADVAGIVPLKEGATWVAYPSAQPTVRGCGL